MSSLKTKKTKSLRWLSGVLIVGAAFFLSGCSLQDLFSSSYKGEMGVLKSVNKGDTFEFKNTIAEKQNLKTAEILTIKPDPADSSKLYLGTIANGVLKTENGGDSWQKINALGSVRAVEVNPKEQNIIYAAGIENNRGKIVRSNDGGNSWKDIYIATADKVEIASIVASTYDAKTIWAGDSNGLLIRSKDGGDTWEKMTELSGPITKIALDTKDDRNVYLIVFQKGAYKIDFSKNITFEGAALNFAPKEKVGEAPLVDLSRQLPGGWNANSLLNVVADPVKGGRVYLTASGGILRSDDGGNTWEAVPTLDGIKGLPIRVLAISPRDNNVLYFVAGGVFYRSADGGNSWQSTELKGAPVIWALAVDPNNLEVIYLGIRQGSN